MYEDVIEVTGEEGLPLQRCDYEKYISSLKWMVRKKQFYAGHARKCLVCGVEEAIHLHHHTYKRLGREWDEDLVPLCVEHHEAVHRLHRSIKGLSLTKATERILGHKLPTHVSPPGSKRLRRQKRNEHLRRRATARKARTAS